MQSRLKLLCASVKRNGLLTLSFSTSNASTAAARLADLGAYAVAGVARFADSLSFFVDQ